ncbi:hypothetical protein [Pseudomonas sp. C11]|jgi:hypothetical protein|uniref:hypothetical protein n=1 Tax=Pseudomonas sp. C11 TaxID=3075550 RepID=UPI002AFF5815|nr:hypothetical protein [Pseudomonas sp. C11]
MSADAVHLFHIAYSEATYRDMPAGYQLLDNMAHERDDWREYWPIRRFLLEQPLDEQAFYGFFSPRFKEKTGLDHAHVTAFVQASGADVCTFSPQPDMGAFFLNVFEQEELFQPGFLETSQAFLARAGIDLALRNLVMDSRQVVFSNYIVARPAFWRRWLELNEQLFAICEQESSELAERLRQSSSYPGAVPCKVFLMERLASLLLAIEPQWRVRAYNTFDCAWSASRLNQFRLEAVMSDALKIAMREQGFGQYLEAFTALRDRLR